MAPYLSREEQVEEVEISSGGMAKIDAAYPEGGAQTIENDFDVRIDQYASGVTELRRRSLGPKTHESRPCIRRADKDIGGVAGKSEAMSDIGQWF